ncbi:MAG: acetylxylan esterase [Capsulimonadales bacterium]|nr:acetylxylan esterase [Capsulimonadales bacterium]
MYTVKAELPDPFAFDGGGRVSDAGDWRRRRAELLNLILGTEYGHLPPTPTDVYAEILHAYTLHDPRGVSHATYRVVTEGGARPFWFLLSVLTPTGDGPFPVVLCGDACWRYITHRVESEILQRGYILATFNRTEIVPDDQRTERDRALHQVYPEGDYGALAAWAWGYHRAVDVLQDLPRVDPDRIAIVGHSRGGKAALLAGATDERIALTSANNSGCGGAGSFRVQGEGCELLENILGVFPYWFSPRLNDYIGRDEELPFDQHEVKALVAPRALLTTEAIGDLWANPIGTYQTYLGAREVYRFLDADDLIGVRYREGGHDHSLDDWQTLLDFSDRMFYDRDPGYSFDPEPFPGMAPAFPWTLPPRAD